MELHYWVKMLITLRKRYQALRQGDYQCLFMDTSNGRCVFARLLGEEKIVVAMNAGAHPQSIRVPVAALNWGDGRTVQNLIDGQKLIVGGGSLKLDLPPWGGVWIG